MTIVLRPEAEADLQEARDWYDARRQGLGSEFIGEVDAVFHRLAINPQHFPKLQGELRRALVRRRTVVVGVLHQRRDPAVWQRRQTS